MKTPENDNQPSAAGDRQKHWEEIVSAAIREVEMSHLKPRKGFQQVTFFGAMGIDPKHLAIWCFFGRDSELKKAEKDGFTREVHARMRERLKAHGYPEHLLPPFFLSFATTEDVQRTSGGNLWHYLK